MSYVDGGGRIRGRRTVGAQRSAPDDDRKGDPTNGEARTTVTHDLEATADAQDGRLVARARRSHHRLVGRKMVVQPATGEARRTDCPGDGRRDPRQSSERWSMTPLDHPLVQAQKALAASRGRGPGPSRDVGRVAVRHT